ncbi:putative Leucine Zipper And CTNNBIP1 Domain-Containing Protein [Blattamonas nauphoetae]|uniref:Leucine Zipper And CTNNBIP1 Domain-Containing Protein n=1 Tax=Blattamonas nauphoetae TaxID=2049346 RepID=A0ABQ9XFN8_9EUKA|nr:putative Leucine Zipper And CTNNBIP1 Domain-Containing Protein [Blattamonas nauphoetae]
MLSDKALKDNIETQLTRLTNQLADLEEMKDDLSPEEYTETKQETLQQLQEFNESLVKMSKGNMTVADELTHTRLALQAAISQAFQTPEVIQLFAKRNGGQLRLTLEKHKRDHQLQKITDSVYYSRAVEILVALKALGDQLSPQEEDILARYGQDSMSQFSAASNSVGADNVLATAGKQISEAQKR